MDTSGADSADEPAKKTSKKKKSTRSKKKSAKGRAQRLSKDLITNERGEIVTIKEYTLSKTYNYTILMVVWIPPQNP